MPLLNRLAQSKGLSDFDWVVVMDDDFLFERGSISSFLAIAGRAGFALAQPAHAADSIRSYWFFSLFDPLALARMTTFVEIGPIVAVQREWVDRVLPFPEGSGMGWGMEFRWFDLRTQGARLGIVDWVTLRHLEPVGKSYDNSPEEQCVREMLHERGHRSVGEIQNIEAIWRPWQRRPSWVRNPLSG